ncbi:hypothetical protein I308_106787 [Cryptococcus tetragattii IND107]|uniref:Uncharacterized protein n=1 Tax=Cryptococcus tetragattii IND107 TaxID=1296105 RepID=A0ABR3BHP8_9TREE|nr:hypothetical protein I308_06329 [Cryptococcus tetragattii IND107]
MPSVSETRQARPEAVLIVLFLIIALYVLFGRVGRSRDKGSDGSDGAESENLRSRNLEEGLESEKKRMKHSSSGKEGQGAETPSTTNSDTSFTDMKKDSKKKRNKEERRSTKDKEDRANKRKKRDGKEIKKKESKTPSSTPSIPSAPKIREEEYPSPPNLPVRAIPSIAGARWRRDPNQRPERARRDSTSSILLERNADGSWKKPPLSKDGVKFDDGGKEGKETNRFAVFSVYDTPVTLYDQTGLEGWLNHASRKRQPDDAALYGKLDGSESPLISLKQSGKLSGKLIKFMEKAEYLASHDLLDPRLRKDVLAMALSDRWLDGVGTIPEVISDTLRQFVVEKQIDIVKIIEEYSAPPVTDSKLSIAGKADSRLNQIVKFLLDCGFDLETLREDLKFHDWKKMSAAEIRNMVREWTGRQLQKGKAVSLIAGFFIPYYRATSSYKAKHLTKMFPPKWRDAIGPHQDDLIGWLRYIGQAFIISRMFSPTGADISEEYVRVCVSRRKRVVGFVMDFTIFTPEPDEKELHTHSELTSIFQQAEAAICRVKYLGLRWVDHLNEVIYPQPDGRKLFVDNNPFHATRLTFRPGLKKSTVNAAALRLATSNVSTPRLLPDAPIKRDRKIMNVSQDLIHEKYEANKGSYKLNDAFARSFRAADVQTVRFVNKHQYHWYQSTGSVNDSFDETTFNTLLMLCSIALSKCHLQKKFKIKGETDYRIDEESVMDFQYDAGYGIVQSMDFGGMMPLEGASTVTPRFLQLDTFVGLRSIMLPVMFHIQNKTKSFPASSSLILKDEWGMSKFLYGPKAINVTFHGQTWSEKEHLKREILEDLSEKANKWVSEELGQPDDALKRVVLQKVDAAVSMIKTRVRFVALGEQQPSADERDSKNERLWDFDLPIEYLPALLR